MSCILTADRLESLLKEYGLPCSFSHFSEPTAPPFIVWTSPQTDNFTADNSVYTVIPVLQIELYSRLNVPQEEAKLEKYLTEKGVLWDKVNQTWIDDEKVMMTVYDVL